MKIIFFFKVMSLRVPETFARYCTPETTEHHKYWHLIQLGEPGSICSRVDDWNK